MKREETIGLRGMPEGELTFVDLEVPADMVVMPPSGFRRGFADLMNAYNSQRVGAGTVAMGIAAGGAGQDLRLRKRDQNRQRRVADVRRARLWPRLPARTHGA